MAKMAINWAKYFFISLIISAVFLLSPTPSQAVQYQQCAANSSCTIGEFLYDDDYQPIAVGSTCTLTTRQPDNNILLNAVNMAGTADGWYSYSVGTSGLSNGIYRGQMCCVTGSENMCLDKTFEISATLSTLVSDIWASPNRSLTSFGNIVSGVWSNSTRSLTSSSLDNGTSLATSDIVSSVGSSLAVLSAQVSEVQTDIATIDTKVDSLQTSVSTIQTNTTNILNKWGAYSVTDILNYVDGVETQLGNNTQTCADNSVFGHIQCLLDKWGADSASSLYVAANGAYTTSVALRSELNFNGKSTTAYDEIIALKAYVDTIETSIGSTSDTSAVSSIFGKIKQVKEAVEAIDNSTLDLNDLLAKWGSYSATDIYNKIVSVSTQVSAINTVSNIDNITNNNITQTADLLDLQNQVLAMRAILNVNRTLLEKLDNKPVIKSWLENGSIIFKNLITNPSATISQDVPFVYYLPPEVKLEDIIKKSPQLTIKYDASKGALSATGDFKLKPKDTVILEIEVKDIWSVTDEKINSLRRESTDLFAPLKKTSYFAQGASLHSDIQASLDRIVEIQKTSKLPEDKIKDFKDAQIELSSVNKKMDSLKEIVAQAGSIGTLSGFIGGVQTMAVWGIVVVLVAGFVFLGLYIRSLNQKNAPTRPPVVSETTTTHHSRHKSEKSWLTYIAIVLFFGVSFGASSTLAYYFGVNRGTASTPEVLSATSVQMVPTTAPLAVPTLEPTLIPTIVPEMEEIVATEPEEDVTEIPIQEPKKVAPTITPTSVPIAKPTLIPTVAPTSKQVASAVKKVVVTPSINSYVNLRSMPNRTSFVVVKVLSGQELAIVSQKYNELGELWLNTNVGDQNGWILAELTQPITTSATIAPSAKIKIIVPAFDTVYLYSRPSFNASVTTKITEDQYADILVETKRWSKVILSKINQEGWISRDFIEKAPL